MYTLRLLRTRTYGSLFGSVVKVERLNESAEHDTQEKGQNFQ